MASNKLNYIKKSEDLHWCKDCGHWDVRTALNEALKRTQWDYSNIVIVSDIGCIGLIDRHFNTNAFHGLHGRSITYASGIKLASPELHVIVLIGDGGCGIGGTHIVNAARRNIGITLLVCNNFNYGMTGCQQSVTTPIGGITKTSFHGNIESPLDVCALALAGNASWVGRIMNTKKDFKKFVDLIHSAMTHRGFSLLDIHEMCSSGFAGSNDIKDEVKFSDFSSNYKTGLIHSDEREEYSDIYRKYYYNHAETEIDGMKGDLIVNYDSKLTKKVRIVFAGSAGQSIQTAAKIFGAGAIISGLHSTQRNTDTISRQSGYSISETIISPEPIDFAGINVPDYLIILSKDGLEEAKSKGWIGKMTDAATIIARKQILNQLPTNITFNGEKLIEVNIKEWNNKHSEKALPIIALTHLVESTKWFPTNALLESAEKMSPNYGDFIKTVIQNTVETMRDQNFPSFPSIIQK